MKITVERFVSNSDTTVSRVSIDGSLECFGLEDEYRAVKVLKETRIPAGNYKVGIWRKGRLHANYTIDFPDIHKGMLHILDVPDFSDILIHCGNNDKQTAGCLLVGQSVFMTVDNMSIGASRDAYKKFYPKVIQAANGGNLEIEFIDLDR